MPFWKTTPVSQAPLITRDAYGAFRTERGEIHLFGHNVTEGFGRVSSALTSFNRRKRLATTRSGRKYKLVGGPGWVDPDALYVLRFWLEINKVEWYDDVTLVMLERGLQAAKQTPRQFAGSEPH